MDVASRSQPYCVWAIGRAQGEGGKRGREDIEEGHGVEGGRGGVGEREPVQLLSHGIQADHTQCSLHTASWSVARDREGEREGKNSCPVLVRRGKPSKHTFTHTHTYKLSLTHRERIPDSIMRGPGSW